MEVDKVLQEICSYSFTKENIVSFLLQESKKYSTLSLFKHMLLSVVDCESIELLISTFYHLEYGSNSLEEIVLCYHNREIKKTKKDLFLDRKEKMKKVIHEFTNGSGSSFKDILSYGEAISTFLATYTTDIEKELKKKLSLYENFIQEFSVYDEKLLSLRKAKKEAQKSLKEKEPLVLHEKKIHKNGEEKVVTKTYKFFKQFAYQKYAMRLDLKIEALKKEKSVFQEKQTQFLNGMGELFSSSEGNVFWNTILTKYEYYNRSIPLEEVLQTVFLVGESYRKLVQDFYIGAKMIQEYPKLCGFLKNGNVLPFVCKKIRERYISISGEAWDIHVRKVDVSKPKNSSYRVYGYLELPKKMEELSKVFLEILKEKDPSLFVKKCANVYLDLVIVQPYQVGNLQTIRFLLSLMLLMHGIVLPSIFVVADKVDLKNPSSKTYGEVEKEFLLRYAYFYPKVIKKV